MLRLIIIVPFLAVLGIFFLWNQELYPIAFPFVESWKMSIGFLVLLLGLASFVVGALTLFVSLIKQWRKVKQANKQIQELEKKLNDLREQYINNLTQASTTAASEHPVVQEPMTVIGHSAEEDAKDLTLNK